MEHAALVRARRVRAWATCAPAFVRAELEALLARGGLPAGVRERIAQLADGLEHGAPGTWCCRFPALAGADAPPGVEGGLLALVAVDPTVPPPRGARPAEGALELGPAPPGGLHLVGLPEGAAAMVIGPSGGAAAWLAARARATGRSVPADVVVSAALVPGPDGEPRLAPVAGGAAKARVVAREAPGARLLLCGDADGVAVEALRPGAPVRDLEARVWGAEAIVDRAELIRIAALAGEAFEDHDYATAGTRYEQVVRLAGPADGELLHEACLRRGSVAVHDGRAEEAAEWFARADAARLPPSRRGALAVERLCALAGRAIDTFRPGEARALLDRPAARNAASPDESDLWKRIQVLGAWRRLLLLEGDPDGARARQLALLEATEDDPVERPRALLDLGLVEIRRGDPVAAAEALRAARDAIAGMPPTYRLQSRAFLTWQVARHARRGGALDGLGDLLDAPAVDALLAEPTLQAAGRWRLRAVRAGSDGDALRALAAELTGFQRWYLGVFLLEAPPTREVAVALLAEAPVDLAGLPALDHARAALRAGQVDRAALMGHAAY